ncbi:bifunctional adenosylcobinamide kinase/adenosylcobinamide-phosphate guanylyltransferase [Bacillus sp. EB600]|uniref:bifunctional adenosylcobinamide kinase/adenosylcobinamide-phosphate guanylyltransferase n=1 Tax=Bacillus sp. EB600 TaxID=2806345 RepID=UPI002109340F|nr:bifunctional adenosylcobinamide kinase/adenosylcobinamide-phosphate guanylyltransferase [Bacillus sp. EB600]MCQ6279213.1 bifunctional adenosylcobinamide kinase/adenosylcobinamide-phosphate guanylyltransferase [Bacillus sp. EB600]
MHFITGGAFNGKRAWVKNTYQVNEHDGWISAYENELLPLDLTKIDQDLLIFEGIEIWLKTLTEQFDLNECRAFFNRCLDHWLAWEKSKVVQQLVLIGTDITKGIVPLEKENRVWRDLTGWAYQDIAAKSDRVDVIWYGLSKTIK